MPTSIDMGRLSEAEVVQRWRAEVVANSERLDDEADKDGHDWHSLWAGFCLGVGRGDLTDWTHYKRLGFPVEMEGRVDGPDSHSDHP